jgi:hypothetical protein
MSAKKLAFLAIVLIVAAWLTGCRVAAPVEDEGESPSSAEPTEAAPALPVSDEPPQVENDAPAGICEDTTNILSRVDRAPRALFRALALDNRAGSHDGDGIVLVRFSIFGEGLNYLIEEEIAPYCILGGNEPECGEWSRDGSGRYTWGQGGPVVQPGDYIVTVEVVAHQPDSLSGSNSCSWNFGMRIVPRQE